MSLMRIEEAAMKLKLPQWEVIKKLGEKSVSWRGGRVYADLRDVERLAESTVGDGHVYSLNYIAKQLGITNKALTMMRTHGKWPRMCEGKRVKMNRERGWGNLMFTAEEVEAIKKYRETHMNKNRVKARREQKVKPKSDKVDYLGKSFTEVTRVSIPVATGSDDTRKEIAIELIRCGFDDAGVYLLKNKGEAGM